MQEKLAEAERRIDVARSTQAKSLDLGDLALSELPTSLGSLPHLKALYLSGYRLNQAGELKFDFRREPSEITDLQPLVGLQDLQSLYLWSKGVTDLQPLAGLQGLQSLYLSGTCVTGLPALAGLHGLQSLDLSNTRVRDVQPLAELQELQSLKLMGTGVTDLQPLARLLALQSLDLSNTRVTDLQPLAGLQELQNLHLRFTPVTDLKPLARFQELQSLDIAYTSVTDLRPLAGLQKLQSLMLAGTGVTDLQPLAGLQELRSLNLYGCQHAVPEKLLRIFANHPRLTELVADLAIGVPQVVLSKEFGDNCLQRLRNHLAELELEAESENELKVIQTRAELPRINLNFHPSAPSDKKRREVFISYAWGDDTPTGKIREETVDRLYSALATNGFQPVRDCNHMRSGDRISAFIRQLTRADLVVAVISDKYLRSSYCMSEIHGLWQKSQADADLMAERLVPVVLPEVQITRPGDRAPYVRYWREQKEELEELLRELGPDLDPEIFRELRLIRSFSQEVDGILVFLQDVLMPNKLEAQLDDGFQAVRDALRRRMGV
jgi:Leucine-rich repeat (LRR) protein